MLIKIALCVNELENCLYLINLVVFGTKHMYTYIYEYLMTLCAAVCRHELCQIMIYDLSLRRSLKLKLWDEQISLAVLIRLFKAPICLQ